MKRSFAQEFMAYFFRIWRTGRPAPSRLIAWMHGINRLAILVFLLGLLFFFLRKALI